MLFGEIAIKAPVGTDNASNILIPEKLHMPWDTIELPKALQQPKNFFETSNK